MEPRYRRSYDSLLPEYYPVKLIGAFISLDFVVGCPYKCSFCISRRHPSRSDLFDKGVVIDNRVLPQKMYSWLRSMPSYAAGVQLRIGHDTDAGTQFDKSAALIQLVDQTHSITYLTRKPFTEKERRFFEEYRKNVLLKLTATPQSASLAIARDPLQLVNSAATIDQRMKYWVVGPLVEDSADVEGIIDALPAGSRLFLKRLNYEGLPHLCGIQPMSESRYASLEQRALACGHIVTERFCNSLAAVGQGFFDVDKILKQPDGPTKERELGYCAECASHDLCHGQLDVDSFVGQLREQLDFLQLTLAAEPKRTGTRSFEVTVKEPSSRGEETYLNHAIKPPVNITLNTRERGRSQGGCFCNVDPAVLRRWYNTGFFPVTEQNMVAEGVLVSIERAQHHGSI